MRAFSANDVAEFVLTPLAAALVEAMPDRKVMARIKRRHSKSGRVPTSVIFPTQESIAAFYAENPTL